MLAQSSLFYLYLSTFSFSSAFTPFTSSRVLRLSVRASSSITMSSSPNENIIGLSEIGSESQKSSSDIVSNNEVTSWRDKIRTSIARSRKIKGGNYVQISTVDPATLEPRCRTVVFRGFLKENGSETDVLKMITDKRSCKYSEVTASLGQGERSNCELLWWFAKSSEQYRIRGHLKFVGADEEDASLLTCRKDQWGNLSDLAREQFFWRDPGLPFEEQLKIPEGGRDSDGKVLPPPDNFLLMLLYPKRCDYLRLGDNFRQIDSIIGNQIWDFQRVNP
mmetsp:Transcript_352/g.595  ORF Transcript_352/g.595 Transcript_352/m.595 type:complete len:277 (+) Transcript_352:113-943(+)